MSYKGFQQVELRRPERSTFDLSHERRVSSRIGKLTPVFVTETMPNDTFYGSSEVLIKLAPMIAPIYHRLNLYVHYFFVPNRLLWKDWETFITGGNLGEAVTLPPVPPNVEIGDLLSQGYNLLDKGSLADYMGIPNIPDTDSATWGNRTLDLMPIAAFFRLWYDYYRDRNYYTDVTPETLLLPSGTLDAGTYGVLFGWDDQYWRCWEHDYFTSALPWTQRGQEVLMPIAGTGVIADNAQTGNARLSADGSLAPSGNILSSTGVTVVNPGAGNQDIYLDVTGDVDITSSDISINDLRRAVRLQEWLERNALAGSRYNESIMAHFGRKTSDSRLQRAEYLGGGKAVVQVSEVMTTAYSVDADTEVVPPGNMAGRGSSYANTNKFSYNCEEHGFIIGVLSVMPTSSYMQGIPRMFLNRNTFLEYPWPSFAHLGEQEVYKSELYATPATVPADRTTQEIFGYQSRYADWKYIPSSSHGDFRNTLDFWHLTRKFATEPELGEDFVKFDDTLQDRIFNVSGVDTLWMYIYNNIRVKRSLPYFGTPML